MPRCVIWQNVLLQRRLQSEKHSLLLRMPNRQLYYTNHYLDGTKAFIKRLIAIKEYQYVDGFCDNDNETEQEIFGSNSIHYGHFFERMTDVIEKMLLAEVIPGAVKRGIIGEERVVRLLFEGHTIRIVIFIYEN